MSLSSIQSSIDSLNRELVQLQKYQQDNAKKIEEKYKEIERIRRSLSSTSNISVSTLKSKNSELERCGKSISELQKKGIDFEKKINDKKSQIARKSAEYQAEQRKQIEQVQKLEKQEQDRQRENNIKIQKQLESMRTSRVSIEQTFLHSTPNNVSFQMSSPIGELTPPNIYEKRSEPAQYDFFISYASEDKEDVARPLYDSLTKQGAKVWYDEFSLTIGDHLRRSIDRGLVSSRYGIVIFSEHFFSKSWPQYELDGLVHKQLETNVILPIWHNISVDAIRKISPALLDIIALKTSDFSIEEIAQRIIHSLS